MKVDAVPMDDSSRTEAQGYRPSRRDAFFTAIDTLRAPLRSRFGPWSDQVLRLSTIIVLFFGFAGQGVRNIVGYYGSGIVMGVIFLVFFLAYLSSEHTLRRRRYTVAPLLFVLVCTLSVTWSFYPVRSALNAAVSIGATLTALCIEASYGLEEIVDLLITTFKSVLIVSLILEAFVSLVLRERLAPLTMRDWEEVPEFYYWVDNNLFLGGPIKGFVGNRNPLAFIALLLIICLCVRWVQRRNDTIMTLMWVGAGVATLALTRSSTVIVIIAAAFAVAIAFIAISYIPYRYRARVISAHTLVALLLALLGLIFRVQLTDLLGRSPDMSGRGDIWRTLLPLIEQRPILGWGWTLGWPTDIEMFATLVVRFDGTPTTQAHNAYIEALFQTGFIGMGIIVVAVAVTFYGSFVLASRALERKPIDCAPALLMTALFIQSFVESRLLSEGNWLLFVIVSAWVASQQPLLSHYERHYQSKVHAFVRFLSRR